MINDTPVYFLRIVLPHASTVLTGTHTPFSVSSLPQQCHVALLWCDFTSSDDDEHNTDNNYLLLFADSAITPALLEGRSDVDVLHTALGCRFALDIFTISQQLSPTPDHDPLPHDPKFVTL